MSRLASLWQSVRRWALGFLLLALSLSSAAPAVRAQGFRDLKGYGWAARAISTLAAEGVIRGVAPGRFGPNLPITRAEFALWLAATLRLTYRCPCPTFKDVPPGSWEYAPIQEAYQAGLLSPVAPGKFAPGRPVTRLEAAQALVTALGLTANAQAAANMFLPYSDVNRLSPAQRGAVAIAYVDGLMRGFPGGYFRPSSPVSRAQAAVILYTLSSDLNLPPPPQVLTVSQVSTSSVTLTWQPPPGSPTIGRYLIWRQVNGGPPSLVADTEGTSYVDQDVPANATLTYTVRFQSLPSHALSLPSNEVTLPGMNPTEQRWERMYGFTQLLKWELVTGATVGDPVNLDQLDISRLPLVSYTELPGSDQRLLVFSDSPETVTQPGILYDSQIGIDASVSHPQNVRLDYDALNLLRDLGGNPMPARFALVAVNTRGQPAHILVQRWATAGPAPNVQTDSQGNRHVHGFVRLGQQMIHDFLAQFVTHTVPYEITVPPGTVTQPGVAIINPQVYGAVTSDNTIQGGQIIPPDEDVVGIYDLQVDYPLVVDFVMVPANAEPVTLDIQSLPLEDANRRHDRGSYPQPMPSADFGTCPLCYADRVVKVSPGASPSVLTLADGKRDPAVVGYDYITFQKDTLTGNYGVLYHLEFTPRVNTAVLVVPLGGPYLGSFLDEQTGQVEDVPQTILPAGQAALLGTYLAGRRVDLLWTPPSNSYLPIDLVFLPILPN